MVVVHVGDDALLRCFVRAAGGFVRHGGKEVKADRRLHEEFSTHCLLSATMKPQTVSALIILHYALSRGRPSQCPFLA